MSSALDMFNSFQILYPNHSKQQELQILNQHVPGKNKLLIPLLYTVSVYLVIRGGHNITKGDVWIWGWLLLRFIILMMMTVFEWQFISALMPLLPRYTRDITFNCFLFRPPQKRPPFHTNPNHFYSNKPNIPTRLLFYIYAASPSQYIFRVYSFLLHHFK